MLLSRLSPQQYARIGGFFYLLIILLGTVDQLLIRGSLVVPNEVTLTADHLMNNSTLWRIGIVGDILMQAFDLPVMVVLYVLLSPVNKPLAMLSVLFNVVQTALLATNKLTLLVPVILFGNPTYSVAFDQTQVHTLAYLFTDIHNYGFALGLVFFGLACLGYGYLIFHSVYLPRFIGILILIAGISYLINSFTLILVPALYPYVLPLLGLCLIGELTLAVWLLTKGVKMERWNVT